MGRKRGGAASHGAGARQGHCACKGCCPGLPGANEARCADGRAQQALQQRQLSPSHPAPTWRLGHPSHLSDVPESQPGAPLTHYFLLILPWGKQGPSHLLFGAAAPPARRSGRSMGHPRRSAAAGGPSSLPASLRETDTGPAAPRDPGRTTVEWPPRTSHPGLGTRLRPGPRGALRTCLPTPARTCFMDWRCGLGKRGPGSGRRDQRGAMAGGHSPPLLPTACQVPSSVPPAQ